MFSRKQRFFANVMLRRDDDGTERSIVSVRGPSVVHRNSKETGRSEGFALWINFFQVSAERFLAIVDAAHHLIIGAVLAFKLRAEMRATTSRHSVQGGMAITTFVSPLKDSASFHGRESIQLGEHFLPLSRRQCCKTLGRPTTKLSQLKKCKRTLLVPRFSALFLGILKILFPIRRGTEFRLLGREKASCRLC